MKLFRLSIILYFISLRRRRCLATLATSNQTPSAVQASTLSDNLTVTIYLNGTFIFDFCGTSYKSEIFLLDKDDVLQ